jgi:hypothetical protein
VGRVQLGYKSEQQLLSAAQGAASENQAVGHSRSRAERFLLLFFSQFTVLIIFVQFFEQISNSFLYSNYSNKKIV